MEITKIYMHQRPHLDEIASLWALRKFGENILPGVRDAEIVFEGSGGENIFETSSANELEKKGILALGVGGGRFDEHPGVSSSGVQEKCTFDLVLEALGMENDPKIAKLSKFVRETDLKAVGHPFDLATIIKDMNALYPEHPLQVINWALRAIEAKYQQQAQFCEAEEFARSAYTQTVERKGKALKIVSGQTDNKEFSRACRDQGAAVVVQQNSSGNVQIFTNKRTRVKIFNVVAEIRREELEAKDEVSTVSPADMIREGKIEGVPEWYYHEEGQMLLNGSLSCQDVPPTKIPFDVIVDIVKMGIEI